MLKKGFIYSIFYYLFIMFIQHCTPCTTLAYTRLLYIGTYLCLPDYLPLGGRGTKGDNVHFLPFKSYKNLQIKPFGEM
jgi:hypothetical protein